MLYFSDDFKAKVNVALLSLFLCLPYSSGEDQLHAKGLTKNI
nr:MAG TPA: hypothetical protein [Caudoviricetes sp.]